MIIGTKLQLGFAVVIVFLAVIAAEGIYNMSNLNSDIKDAAYDKFPKTKWMNSIIDVVNFGEMAIRNSIITEKPELIKAELDKLPGVYTSINLYVDSLRHFIKMEKGKQLLNNLEAKRKIYVDERNNVIKLIKMNGVNGVNTEDETENILFGSLSQYKDDYFAALHELLQYQNDLFDSTAVNANKEYDSSFIFILALTIIAIVLSIAIAIIITKQITKPIKQAVDALDNIANGNLNVNLENNAKDETGQLIASMRVMSSNLNGMISELDLVAQDTADGKLDRRANELHYKGEYANLIGGFNKTLDAVIGPLNVTAEYVDRISKGDIPPQIKEEYKGDFNEIKNNLNQLIDTMNTLIQDSFLLVDAATQGKLDKRANASVHNGNFRKLIEGINQTLDAVIGPLNVTAEYVDRISKGDIPPQIKEEYKGDFNEIKNNLNQLIETMDSLMSDSFMLAEAAALGKLDTRADSTKHNGNFRKLVEGINQTLDNVIGPLNVTAEYVDRISKGDIPPRISDEYKGDYNEIKNNLNHLIDSTNSISNDLIKISNGDFNVKLIERSSNDTLIISTKAMLNNLQEVVNDLTNLNNNTQNGILSSRIDIAK